MATLAEEMALELAGVVRELYAAVEWCVEHDGKPLGDNPGQLADAKKALARAKTLLLLTQIRRSHGQSLTSVWAPRPTASLARIAEGLA